MAIYTTDDVEFVDSFIEQNIELIDNNDWETVYNNLLQHFTGRRVGLFTEKILECGINPLDWLSYIPNYYLWGSTDISEFKVPDNIVYIGENAFASSSIKDLYLGIGLRHIGEGAVYQSEICNVYIDDLMLFSSIEMGGPSAHPLIYWNRTAQLWLKGQKIEDFGIKPVIDTTLPMGIRKSDSEYWSNVVKYEYIQDDIIDIDPNHQIKLRGGNWFEF